MIPFPLQHGGLGRVSPAELNVDPSFSSVVLLAHFDGANNGTAFTDSSGYSRTLTRISAPITSSTQVRFGTTSGFFNTTNDAVSAADAAEFTLGTSDFTIEGWIYIASLPSSGNFPGIASQRNSSSVNMAWNLNLLQATGAVTFDYSTSGTGAAGSAIGAVPNLNAWNHIAAVRSGSSLVVYVNGVGGASHNIGSASIFNSTSAVLLGRLSSTISSNSLNGYLDEFRMTVGVARYTANFTPPSSAFPNS